MIITTDSRRSGNRTHQAARLATAVVLVGFAFGPFRNTSCAASQVIRVKDAAVAQELLQHGGHRVADYGGFQLVETAETVPAEALGAQVQVESKNDEIELNATRIHTRSPQGKALRRARGAFQGQALHLIQFVGPIKPEWRKSIEQLGVAFINYVPQNAFLVRGNAEALNRLQAWAAATNVVQWDGPFADTYKLHPGARVRDEFGLARQLDTDVFAIQLLAAVEGNTNTLELIDGLKLAPMERDFRVMQYRNLVVRLNPEVLEQIAAQPDVVSIQPYHEPAKRDERQAQIVAGNIVGNALAGPGYLDWLAGKGFTQSQFDASAFAVDVTDSGIDNGSVMPGHFGLYQGGNPTASSRVIYNRVEGVPHVGSTTAGCDGHGNLNAHILGGFSSGLTGFPHTDSGGYQYGLGICPFVRIGSSVIFDPDQFTNPNYADLQSRAYAGGARISANSWGATNNSYTMDAQAFDALVRDAQPEGAAVATPGNQEMVIVFAAGNLGPNGNTVGAPGTAKNVITVGASENVRSMNASSGGKSSFGTDGCGFGDATADAVNDLATFSSRGPCSDGRQKPDLVAPGTHITGGVPQAFPGTNGLGAALSCFKASSICGVGGGGISGSTNNFFPLGQQFYTVSSGTSHAAPAVAGACALLRQYFLNQNLPAPSPAMTKAFLMNSTRFLTGAGANDNLWSPGQGMGGLNLGRAFDGVPRMLRDQAAEDIFTQSGQTRVFTGRIAQTNAPVRVTLAWTDAPGSTTGNAFNNDLDLTVEVGGVVYLGNHFSGAYSVAGGVSDPRNNVESVLLPAGVSGDVAITVTAANINSDGVPNYGTSLDQDFALVVCNATNTTVPRISVAAVNLAAEGYFPTNGAIDPGEMVTINLALRNTGTLQTSNLIVSLLATNGINQPSAAQSYGEIGTDGVAVSRSFTFVANGGNCGGRIMSMIKLQDGDADLAGLTLELPIGLQTQQEQSYSNAAALVIPDSGNASIYPAPITISGVAGVVQKATVTLRGFSHSWPDDVDVLLVGPEGQKVMLMGDCGGGNSRNGISLTFDDDAAVTVPDSATITPGTYKPTNIDTTTDNFPAPAPSGPFGTALSVFNGTNPNGTWLLYVQDDGAMDSGSITQGWVLSLTTSNLSCVDGAANLADLAIGSQFSTNSIFVRSNFAITVTATNQGPGSASFVVVSNTLPAGFVLSSIETATGRVSQSNNIVIWELGVLGAGNSASLNIEGKLLLSGNYENHCTISSPTADGNGLNNTSSSTIAAFKANGSGLIPGSNTPPVLNSIPNLMVHAGSSVQLTNVATDQETPAGDLVFSLVPGGPPAAQVQPNTGLFSWLTTDLDAQTTNHFVVQVADSGTPVLSASQEFSVVVVDRPLITSIVMTSAVVSVTWSAVPGQSYQLQYATNLTEVDWNAVVPNVIALGGSLTHTNGTSGRAQQFYRVLVLP